MLMRVNVTGLMYCLRAQLRAIMETAPGGNHVRCTVQSTEVRDRIGDPVLYGAYIADVQHGCCVNSLTRMMPSGIC
jgi:hypothetical protein